MTIAAAETLIEEGKIGGGLVIVPSSLKYQWARQIDKFTAGLANVMVIDGTAKRRVRQYEEVMAGKVEYTIMNYEQVVNDWKYVHHLPRDFIALDEATYIKTPSAARSRRVKQLKARYRWALTGQAVENRAEEIYSIMEWVDPSVLGPPLVFDKTFIVRDGYGNVTRYRNLPLLHRKITQAMVRKTWDDPDVRDQMPKVQEYSVFVPFDPAGAKLYRTITSELLDVLQSMTPTSGFDIARHYDGEGGAMAPEAGQVMSRFTCLRMLCDGPGLLHHSADLFDGRAPAGLGATLGSSYAAELRERNLVPARSKTPTPKLDATIALIEEIMEEDPHNKVVLFSFFKEALAQLAERANKICSTAIFTGDLTAKERDVEQQRFANDPKCRLFLSSDAGGYGVDLPMANYLISYDLPASAGAWNQRNARIIRLSSEFDHITLISVLMGGSIEERQYDSLMLKHAVAQGIMDGKGFDAKGGLDLDLATLTDFLQAHELTTTT